MSVSDNPLIEARDRFAARHPEGRIVLNGREWGVIESCARAGAPVLVLLPGTLGRADIFWHQIDALNDLHIVSLSYPASGGLTDWVDDLDVLLAARAIEQVALLGSSLGGYFAQHYAETRPERVNHLFAANTLASVNGVAKRPPYALDLWSAPIEELRGGFAAAMQAQVTTRTVEAQLTGLLLAESNGRIPEMELRARLDALKTAPALAPADRSAASATVIDSADDPLLPPHIRQSVRNRLAQAPGFRFSWGGHFPYVLRPDLYTGLIRARLGLAPMPREWEAGEA